MSRGQGWSAGEFHRLSESEFISPGVNDSQGESDRPARHSSDRPACLACDGLNPRQRARGAAGGYPDQGLVLLSLLKSVYMVSSHPQRLSASGIEVIDLRVVTSGNGLNPRWRALGATGGYPALHSWHPACAYE